MGELEKLRQELSVVDQKLLETFLRRMRIVEKIADYKGKTRGTIFVPEQEARVLEKAQYQTPPELSMYTSVFVRTLMRLSRERQYECTIKHAEILKEAKTELGQVKTLAVPSSNRLAAGEATKSLYPEASLVYAEYAEQACRQVAAGLVDLAVCAPTEPLFSLLIKHELFIQGHLYVAGERYVAICSDLIVPDDAQTVSLLIRCRNEDDFQLVINILGDLDLPLAGVRSLANSRFYLAFSAEPTSLQAHRALYQIQQEVETALLGWYA